MTTTSEQPAPSPSATLHIVPASVLTILSVEVCTLDQYGDPGFVRYRGDFHTASAAVGFAITQAHNLITAREGGRVAVTLTDHNKTHPGSKYDNTVTAIGSTGEIACALAADPDYSAGVRRVELPATSQVLDIITATNAGLGATDDAAGDQHLNDDGDDADGWFVHVQTIRLDPIPNSKAVIGPMVRGRAESTAGLLAQRLGGDLTAHPGRGVITVRHPATVSEEDQQAVHRYERITAALAVEPTLSCGSDEHRRVVAEISELAAAAHNPGGTR